MIPKPGEDCSPVRNSTAPERMPQFVDARSHAGLESAETKETGAMAKSKKHAARSRKPVRAGSTKPGRAGSPMPPRRPPAGRPAASAVAGTAATTRNIDVLLDEKRVFKPNASFRKQAHVRDPAIYARALKNPEAFWAGIARELHWDKPFTKTLEWKPPVARWFTGGRTNLSYNCLDRHLDAATRNKAALIWEGEPGDER